MCPGLNLEQALGLSASSGPKFDIDKALALASLAPSGSVSARAPQAGRRKGPVGAAAPSEASRAARGAGLGGSGAASTASAPEGSVAGSTALGSQHGSSAVDPMWSHSTARDIQKYMSRTRVAFLMHRAPEHAAPDKEMLRLDAEMKNDFASTSRAAHNMGNHAAMPVRVLQHERRRDRLTEYHESKLMSGNIGFRK
eukprot:SRR837773.3063.p1 GENE.SRR837773.3063~~SRR837773.3063.p1  ORF type:complete len:228 (+),score=42.90 SRR837773.3063:96-686(+)